MSEIENTSGGGPNAAVPPEIDTWNWGAFLLNWIWGIGNNTYIALLMFVPVVNLVMPFVLGAKGSEWAWRNRRWESIAAFKKSQRNWALWGLLALLALALSVFTVFYVFTESFKSSEVYQLGWNRLQSSREVVAIVGEPMKLGMPQGRMKISGAEGDASFTFDLSGPQGRGKVAYEARRDGGRWRIVRLVFEDEASGRRVDLSD